MKVYIAASSRIEERNRVRLCMHALEAAPGLELAYDWLTPMQGRTTTRDSELSDSDAIDQARLCLKGVEDAEAVWLLAPNSPTRGAWVELGVAHSESKLIVGSGDYRQSIFCQLADFLYEKDAEALAFFVRRAEIGARQ